MKIKFYSIVILLTFLTSCENYAQQKNDLQKESLKQLLLAQKVQLLNKMGQGLGGLSSRVGCLA